MKCVLCDDDRMLRSMVELVVNRCGHEVVGIADNTTDGASLVLSAKPDLVILDGSLGVNTDFDIIESANRVQATVIVFSFYADEAVMSRYAVHPIVVAKPDFEALQRKIELLEAGVPLGQEGGPAAGTLTDRRRRPARSALGRDPVGPGDASAFYEALSNGAPRDAILAIDLPAGEAAFDGSSAFLLGLRQLVRRGDRLLAAGTSLKVFLPAGGEAGAAAFLSRLRSLGGLPPNATFRFVTIGPDESPVDAFDRLKRSAAV